MLSITRHEIPESLRAAKQKAIDRFHFAAPKPARRGAHRISASTRHNLVGIGVGNKIVKNTLTDRPSVRLYVARKLDKRDILQDHLLPNHIEDVETDVIEVGHLRAQIPSQRKRLRPAKPGCSIGFALSAEQDGLLMAGTLGAIVSADGDARYILSNNHVLANENLLPVGALILQPGLLDQGDARTDAIARLSRFVSLSFTKPNRVDCAIAEILAPEFVRSSIMARVGKLSGSQPISVVEGMAVEKVGRGSGYTTGEVFDVSATVTLGYEMGEITFLDQILIRSLPRAFSEDGDSGALVVDNESGRAAGLLIGGSGNFSVANHLEDVLTELDIRLVV